MLLALDIGNTNITVGVFDGPRLVFGSRMATDQAKMEDQYTILLLDLLRLYGVDAGGLEGGVFSSVVPVLDNRVRAAMRRVTGHTPLQVGPGVKTGINIKIDSPAQLGADLLVAAVAAKAVYGVPCLIWDLGTATKVTVLDKDGGLLGGAIMPGIQTGLRALAESTSLLPAINLDTPDRAVGPDSVTALRSGAVFGTAAMIDGMSARIEAELGYPCKAVATGGLGREVAANCVRELTYDEHLLLTGLRIVYERNRK